MTSSDGATLASRSPANAEEYELFLNRFKLLNLVQQVAHSDVMELVDTVGLDALSSTRGVRVPTSSSAPGGCTRGGSGSGSGSGSGGGGGGVGLPYDMPLDDMEVRSKSGRAADKNRTRDAGRDGGGRRRSSPKGGRITASIPAAAAATAADTSTYRPRRTNQDLRAQAAADARLYEQHQQSDSGGGASGPRPIPSRSRQDRGYGFRSAEERAAYLARLSEPRQRLTADEDGPRRHSPSSSFSPFADAVHPHRHSDGVNTSIGSDGQWRRQRQPYPTVGGAAGDREAAEARRLFESFLRSRYGEGGGGGGGGYGPNDGATAGGGGAGGGSPPPWRRLQPYGAQTDQQRDGDYYDYHQAHLRNNSNGYSNNSSYCHHHHHGYDGSGAPLPPSPSQTWPPHQASYGDAQNHAGEQRQHHHQQQLDPPSPIPHHRHDHSGADRYSSGSSGHQNPTLRSAMMTTTNTAAAPAAGRGGTGPLSHGGSGSGNRDATASIDTNIAAKPPNSDADTDGGGGVPRVPRLLLSAAVLAPSAPSPNPSDTDTNSPAMSISYVQGPRNVNSYRDTPHHPDSQPQPRDGEGEEGDERRRSSGGGGNVGGGVPRMMRTIGSKPKPKGALDSPRVPMDVIKHAANLIAARGNACSPTAAIGLPAMRRSATDPGFPSRDSYPQHAHSQRSPPGDGSGRSRSVVFATTSPSLGALQEQSGHSPTPLGGGGPLRKGKGFSAPEPPLRPFSPVAQQQPQQLSEVPPPASASPSLQAIASAIDKMLGDHQRILEEVVGDTNRRRQHCGGKGSGPPPSPSLAGSSSLSRSPSFSSPGARAGAAAAVGSSGSDDNRNDRDGHDGEGVGSGSDIDELLVFAQLRQKMTAMARDMARIQAAQQHQHEHRSHGDAADGNEGEEEEKDDYYEDQLERRQRSTKVAAAAGGGGGGGGGVARPPIAANANSKRPPRGSVPDAVARRLLSYQVEQAECAAYNERLWNSSRTSQYAFAQRLTAALLEDSVAEVLQEVGGILDEYVDGLAEHELQ